MICGVVVISACILRKQPVRARGKKKQMAKKCASGRFFYRCESGRINLPKNLRGLRRVRREWPKDPGSGLLRSVPENWNNLKRAGRRRKKKGRYSRSTTRTDREKFDRPNWRLRNAAKLENFWREQFWRADEKRVKYENIKGRAIAVEVRRPPQTTSTKARSSANKVVSSARAGSEGNCPLRAAATRRREVTERERPPTTNWTRILSGTTMERRLHLNLHTACSHSLVVPFSPARSTAKFSVDKT